MNRRAIIAGLASLLTVRGADAVARCPNGTRKVRGVCVPHTSTPVPSATSTRAPNTPVPTPAPTRTPTPTSAPSSWTDLGVVDQIAAATTAWGRTISNLTQYGGFLFLGHGDYTDNTPNPCHLMAYGGGAYIDYGEVNTVALLDTRVVGDQLAIPFTDPAIGSYPTASFLHADGTLETLGAGFTPRAWHVFGSALFNGKRYLSGSHVVSSTTDARAIWREDSTGWIEGDFLPNSYLGSGGRVYALFVLGSTLYANPSGSIIKTTDGENWTNVGSGPNRMRKPTVVGGDCYYLTGDAGYSTGLSTLYRFSGSSPASVMTNVYDITVGDDGALYALRGDGRITDLNGATVATAPAGSRSIARMGGSWYAGTTDAHLWREG